MRIPLNLLALILLATALHASEPITPAVDPFQVGSVWKGTRKIEKLKAVQPWQLVVKTRAGDSFTGAITLDLNRQIRAFTLDVAGSVPASGKGPVKFETSEKGGADQRFWGKIEAGALKLDFKGRSRNGNMIEGEAWLSR